MGIVQRDETHRNSDAIEGLIELSYVTPHHAHEFCKAVMLQIVHDHVLACQRRNQSDIKKLLLSKREVDFQACFSRFFGPEASLRAQGVSGIDIRVESPILNVEVKYLRKKPGSDQPVNVWGDVMKDWDWLLSFSNSGDSFKKSAWIVLLPAIDQFEFHMNFQVPKKEQKSGLQPKHFAPFIGIVEVDPVTPSRLRYTSGGHRDAVLKQSGTKIAVRRQSIGDQKDPIWGLTFSRLGSNALKELSHLPVIQF